MLILLILLECKAVLVLLCRMPPRFQSRGDTIDVIHARFHGSVPVDDLTMEVG